MIDRRRFLALSAAALVPAPGHAGTITEWRGTGLGGALSLRLSGAAPHGSARLFARVEAEIAQVESLASLHRDSALRRLNRDGRLAWPGEDLLGLLALAGRVHAATAGAFDPTVQPLWLALAEGRDPAPARDLIGWGRLTLDPREIRLGPGQQLTLNGIAQGWAADRIARLLRGAGFTDALIDMGEISALGHRPDGRPWSAGIADPDGASLGTVALAGRALATSSPRGTLIGAGQPHILGPAGQPPLWATASVSAPSAALADALSTAFCLMGREAIAAALAAFPEARLEALT